MRVASFALLTLLSVSSTVSAASITGEYLEARSCDVYTGPCFANAEMNLAGREAVVAWKVDEGSWNNVSLDGLGVAVVVRSQGTLGDTGVFKLNAGRTKAVILVDEKATAEQQEALVAFAKDSARDLTNEVTKVQSVPFQLENDHLAGKGTFKAGELASIETRALKKGDCVCTNEDVYYRPLTKVDNSSPAYTKTFGFKGDGLDSKWTSRNQRSAFLATFRK